MSSSKLKNKVTKLQLQKKLKQNLSRGKEASTVVNAIKKNYMTKINEWHKRTKGKEEEKEKKINEMDAIVDKYLNSWAKVRAESWDDALGNEAYYDTVNHKRVYSPSVKKGIKKASAVPQKEIKKLEKELEKILGEEVDTFTGKKKISEIDEDLKGWEGEKSDAYRSAFGNTVDLVKNKEGSGRRRKRTKKKRRKTRRSKKKRRKRRRTKKKRRRRR